MDRNLALEFVRVTEAGAIAASRWIGRGDKNSADQAAVDEMRKRFNQIDFKGRVVIGEGERDQAPQLYVGEEIGMGVDPEMDIAVDPLEGTTSVALDRPNALTVVVSGEKDSLLSAPDAYMEKIAVGPPAGEVIDFEAPVKENILKTAKALGKKVEDITVVVLERERHGTLVQEIRSAGARARLIPDGDIEPAIAACLPERGADMLMGIGSSTEAVLAAVPVKVLGGELMAKFYSSNEDDKRMLTDHGIDLDKIYRAGDLASGKALTFTATGVTDGPLLNGVRFESDRIVTQSMVIRGQSGTIRYIETHHNVDFN